MSVTERKTAAARARFYLRPILEELGVDCLAANSSKKTVCPICGQGKNTGCFHLINDQYWHCFSCGRGGDIFDLVAALEGDGKVDKRIMELVYAKYNLLGGTPAQTPSFHRNHASKSPSPLLQTPKSTIVNQDYSSFFSQAKRNLLSAKNYLDSRGISIATAKTFGLGFAPRWRHPKAPISVPFTPRLIIPTSESSYLARDVRDQSQIPSYQLRFQKAKVGPVQLFNAQALADSAQPCFVTEGELDALSIIQCKAHALSLGSASNGRLLLNTLNERRHLKQSLPQIFLALDNDEAGIRMASNLKHQLDILDFQSQLLDTNWLFDGAKDANEALVASPRRLAERINFLLTKER